MNDKRFNRGAGSVNFEQDNLWDKFENAKKLNCLGLQSFIKIQ